MDKPANFLYSFEEQRGCSLGSFLGRVVSTGLVLSLDLIFSNFEGRAEVGLKLSVASVAGSLLLASGLGSLSLNSSLA